MHDVDGSHFSVLGAHAASIARAAAAFSLATQQQRAHRTGSAPGLERTKQGPCTRVPPGAEFVCAYEVRAAATKPHAAAPNAATPLGFADKH